jgi:pyruvate/2-oxoacid:ferredoxin oxidoreductase alpha subunit
MRKFELLRNEAVPPTYYGKKDATTVIMCWGSNKLIVKEALGRVLQEGGNAAALHFGQVYPLTEDMISPYGLGSKKLICVENNAQRQFAGLLKRELGRGVEHHVLKYNGECFTVEELYQMLKPLLI